MRQHHTVVMAKGAQRMHRTAARREPESPALGFAVDGHPLEIGWRRGRHGGRRQAARQDCGQRVPVYLAKQALERRLAGRPAGRKAERRQHLGALPCPPLGDRQDREVVRQQRRHRERQHRRQGIDHAAHPARIGHGDKGGGQTRGRHGQGSKWGRRLHTGLLCGG